MSGVYGFLIDALGSVNMQLTLFIRAHDQFALRASAAGAGGLSAEAFWRRALRDHDSARKSGCGPFAPEDGGIELLKLAAKRAKPGEMGLGGGQDQDLHPTALTQDVD